MVTTSSNNMQPNPIRQLLLFSGVSAVNAMALTLHYSYLAAKIFITVAAILSSIFYLLNQVQIYSKAGNKDRYIVIWIEKFVDFIPPFRKKDRHRKEVDGILKSKSGGKS